MPSQIFDFPQTSASKVEISHLRDCQTGLTGKPEKIIEEEGRFLDRSYHYLKISDKALHLDFQDRILRNTKDNVAQFSFRQSKSLGPVTRKGQMRALFPILPLRKMFSLLAKQKIHYYSVSHLN